MEESKKLPNYQQYGESFMALQKVILLLGYTIWVE